MMARYFSASGIAAGVTFALLLLMQSLIAIGRQIPPHDPTRYAIDFFRVVRAPTVQTRREPPKPPDPVEPAPDLSVEPAGTEVAVRWTGRPQPRAVDPFPGLRGQVDGNAMSLVRVAPVYPRRALLDGLEGYVIVEFTVTAMGTVSDVRIVESTHRVFEAAAIEAARKFKFRPRVVAGQAVEQHGLLNKFTFELDD